MSWCQWGARKAERIARVRNVRICRGQCRGPDAHRPCRVAKPGAYRLFIQFPTSGVVHTALATDKVQCLHPGPSDTA